MSWLTEYLAYTQRQESPQIFHWWDAVTTVAATINRKVWLPKVSDGIERYRIYPGQLMVILVAGAGKLRKSTSIRLPNTLLKASGVKVLDGVTSPEKLLSILGGVGQHSKQGVLTILAPELSVFLSRQNYATALVNLLNDLADAPDKKDFPTQGRGDVTVINACVTLLAATTPVDLAESIPASALQRGFTSRIVFVYANKTDRREPLSETRVDAVKMALAEQARQRLLAGLGQFGQLSGPMDYTDEAREWYDAWYEGHMATDDDESEGWSSRRQDHLLRVGMVLQIMKNQSLALDVDCLSRADLALKIVEENLPDVFAHVGIHSATSSGLDRVMAVFKKAGGQVDNFTLSERCIRYFPDFTSLNKVIVELQRYKWIRKISFDPLSGRQLFELVPPSQRNGGPPKP